MGRAQGKLADSFAGVFGNLRGLRSDQEVFSSAPPGLFVPKATHVFASNPRIMYRKIGLADFLLENYATPAFSTDLIEAALNRAPILYLGRSQSSRMAQCQGDLESLVEQGLCQQYPTISGAGSYQMKEPKDWPAAHKTVFIAWKEQISAPFSPDLLKAGRRLFLLDHLPRGNDILEKDWIIKAFRIVYPGISDQEIIEDLDTLVEQKVMRGHDLYGNRTGYSLNLQTEWPSKHSEVYDEFHSKMEQAEA